MNSVGWDSLAIGPVGHTLEKYPSNDLGEVCPMKYKNRPITPFRRRLWLVYGVVLLVLWLGMTSITLTYTQRYYVTPTPWPTFTPNPNTPTRIPFATSTPIPQPVSPGSVDAGETVTI
jgi:hypothetical protein